MRRPLLIFALALCLLTIPTPIIAQEQITEQTCTPEQWQESQNGLTNEIATLATSENPILILLRLRAFIDTTYAACTGGAFTETDYPTGIVGPISFGGTLYEATLTLTEDGYGSATITTLDGNCGTWPLLSVTGDKTSETDLWNFEGCVAIIEVNASPGWTLDIKRLG